MIYFETLYKRIVDIFVLCLYIYFDISSTFWLLDMGKKISDVTFGIRVVYP